MTIVLAAGGTGGHLFPAEALSRELMARGHEIVVMTDKRGTGYGDIFPGAEIVIVPSAAFSDRSVFGLMMAPFEILAGIAVAFAALMKLKPSAVVGFGGYPSLPVMLAACIARRPTAILSPDALLGRANRLLMNYVKAIAANFTLVRFLPRHPEKIVYTGNPVRPEVLALHAAPYEAPKDVIRLLVFGGSQGARVFSERVPSAIERLPDDMKSRLEIIQQCRPEDLDGVRDAYQRMNVKAVLAPFFKDMPTQIARSHLVIGRSGAGTVSELACIGRPAILVPLPHALDDNQTPNAEALVGVGAGWRLPQNDFTPERLSRMLIEAFADPAELAKRAAAALTLARPNATRALADLIEQLEGAR